MTTYVPTAGADNAGAMEATPASAAPSTMMHVRKRNGGLETADVMKIVRAVERSADGLHGVDPLRVATRTISGLYDGTTTRELDELSIRTAAALIAEEPEYSKLAARLLSVFADKEVQNQDIHSFSQSVKAGHSLGLIADHVAEFVAENSRKLNDAIDPNRNRLFEYFGIRTLYDRYLLKHPESRHSIETTQHFFLRVRLRVGSDPQRSDRSVRSDVEPRLHAELTYPLQLRHAASADVVLLPSGFAPRMTWRRSTTATRTSPSSPSSRVASACPSRAFALRDRS